MRGLALLAVLTTLVSSFSFSEPADARYRGQYWGAGARAHAYRAVRPYRAYRPYAHRPYAYRPYAYRGGCCYGGAAAIGFATGALVGAAAAAPYAYAYPPYPPGYYVYPEDFATREGGDAK